MPMDEAPKDRPLLEAYLLEVVSRALSTERMCERLKTHHYISDAPEALLGTIERMCKYYRRSIAIIFSRIDWSTSPEDRAEDVRLLQNTDDSIRILYEHLRYIEAAQPHRMPWSILSAFENLVAGLLPQIRVMLRPQWRYNYTCIVTDLRGAYEELLSEHQDFQPEVSLTTDVLKQLPVPFHIIGFPALERTNILLHCLLGHELGHLVASEFVTDTRQTQFVDSILPELEKLATENLAGLEDTAPLFRKQEHKDLVANYASLCGEVWSRAADELVSDVVGALVFGPAALFSTLEMGLQGGYDERPTRNKGWYPPWRYRLRAVLTTLEAITPTGENFFPVPATMFRTADAALRATSVNRRYETIEELTKETTDRGVLDTNPVTRLCYRDMDALVTDALTYLLGDRGLRSRAVTPNMLYAKVPALIERLDHRIPPNVTVETTERTEPATLPEIINAAWFHRLSRSERPLNSDGTVNESILALRRVTNNLTMKAIEFADLARRYDAAVPRNRDPSS